MDWSKEEIMFHDCWPRYFAIDASSLKWRTVNMACRRYHSKEEDYYLFSDTVWEGLFRNCEWTCKPQVEWESNNMTTRKSFCHVGYLNKDIELKRNRRKLTVIICLEKIYQKRGRDSFKTEILLLEIWIKIMTDHREWQIRIFTGLTLAARAFTPLRTLKFFTL